MRGKNVRPSKRSPEYRAAVVLVGAKCDCNEWLAAGFEDAPCTTCRVAAALRAAYEAGRRGIDLTGRACTP